MATELQKKWEERISCAVQAREDWADQFRVQMGRDYFEGKQNPGYPETEWISIPKIYSHLKAQLPFLYSMDPYFYVKLKKTHQEDVSDMDEKSFQQAVQVMETKGKVRQSFLNYLKGELKVKPKARLGIQDAMFAYGVLKSRHASDMEKHPNAGQTILDDEGEPLKDPDTGGEQVYPDERPVNKRYEAIRVHPDDFVFDEDAGPLEDSWSFLAQRIRMTKEEMLAHPQFKRSVAKTVAPKEKDADDQPKSGGWFSFFAKNKVGNKDKDSGLVDTWEIYDLKKNETLTIAEGAEDVLIKPRVLPPGIEGHPYSILRFTLRDNSPYPIPPVSPAIDPQKEVSLSRSRWLTHRKRFDRKYEVNVQALEDAETEIDKFITGGDGVVIRKMGSGEAFRPIMDAPLDQQGIQELIALDNDVVEALGTPGNARGVANSDSATEASILDNRLEIREGDSLSTVVDWILDFARKLDQLVQFHIDKDQAVKIIGPQGEFWQLVKQTDYEEIEGEFDYSVNVGASRPRLPDIERAQLMAFFSQVVIPFPQILTKPATMKRMAELFHIEHEVIVEELRQLGEAIMNGLVPAPGQQGGGPSNNPIAQILGQALGQQGGNTNGGGSEMVRQ